MDLVSKAVNGRGIDGDAVLESPLQLLGHDGDVLVASVDVTEGQADKLHVLLLNVLDNFLWCIFHSTTPAFSIVSRFSAAFHSSR